MTEARRSYRIASLDIESLNFILTLIADRLDELEGRRGTPLFKADIDMDQNKITNIGEAINDNDVPSKKQVLTKNADAAVSVTDETAFGLSVIVGISNKYARQDHRHGSPVNPVTAHQGTHTHAELDTHLDNTNLDAHGNIASGDIVLKTGKKLIFDGG